MVLFDFTTSNIGTEPLSSFCIERLEAIGRANVYFEKLKTNNFQMKQCFVR